LKQPLGSIGERSRSANKTSDALGDCVEALDIASRDLHRDSANAAARRD